MVALTEYLHELQELIMLVNQWPVIASVDPPSPYAMVTATASDQLSALSKAVRDSFQDAMAYRGRLREDAFLLSGFSGKKFRLLMNNLISEVPDPRYLEIGVYHGASFCPAIFHNRVRAVGIDNWSEYGGGRHHFDQNLSRYQTHDTDVLILEQDFRNTDYGAIGKFNILFYDGAHDEQSQYDGILYPQPAMDQTHIMIVDDWNWDRVRKGTFDALRDSKLNIDYSIEVRTTFNGEIPLVSGPSSEWHNGTILAVVSKA
jgi:hypothetical protein